MTPASGPVYGSTNAAVAKREQFLAGAQKAALPK
jgi:hypothetical protein